MERHLQARTEFMATVIRHPEAPVPWHMPHRYSVTVEAASLDYELWPDLEAACAELRNRSLEAMMVGSSTDLDGIAAWILERLVLEHHTITTLKVEQDAPGPGIAVTVFRTPIGRN